MRSTICRELWVIKHLQGVSFYKGQQQGPHTHFTFATLQALPYAHKTVDPVPSVCSGCALAGSERWHYWVFLNLIEPSNSTNGQSKGSGANELHKCTIITRGAQTHTTYLYRFKLKTTNTKEELHVWHVSCQPQKKQGKVSQAQPYIHSYCPHTHTHTHKQTGKFR